ncbi:MAG: NADH-quinone oxidoreductase subunit J [Candidatus Poribacteria bacterium]|nr:NADH-quinone oxidoreductase subunit J [Candidatus Poribacteria bacterium]
MKRGAARQVILTIRLRQLKRMEFTLKTFIFYGFALMTVASALIVVTVRNIVHAAFSLMVTLFGVAGLYVFLQADFLAATQVIVYVGGILVLILFGVMMTSERFDMPIQVKGHIERGQLLLGGVIALALLMLLLTVIANTPAWKNLTDDGTELPPTTERIGELILNGQFLLPFEVVSVLLLVALIGAALISRKEVRD